MTPDHIRRANELLDLRDRVVEFTSEIEEYGKGECSLTVPVAGGIANLTLHHTEIATALGLYLNHIAAELDSLGVREAA